MKTIIKYKNGDIETFDDAAPTFDTQEQLVGFVDKDMGVVGDDITFETIEKVEFIP